MDFNSQNRKRLSGRTRFVLLFLVISGVIAFVRHCVAHDEAATEPDTVRWEDDGTLPDSLAGDSVFQLIRKNNVNGVSSFDDDFPDQNDVQLEAAQRNGIVPLDTRSQIDDYLKTGKLVFIGTSPYFLLDELTHSTPYLTPKAFQLVNTIGLNYIDSLQSKGMHPHLLIVTSVLRTLDDVNSLRRGNGNSVERSAHRYGTTIDITYNRFMPLSADGSLSDEPTRYDFQQKLVLAEVLRDLRCQGLCYVKHERRQACFHLTVR